MDLKFAGVPPVGVFCERGHFERVREGEKVVVVEIGWKSQETECAKREGEVGG